MAAPCRPHAPPPALPAVLVRLLQRFQLDMAPGAGAPTYELSMTLPIKGGLPMLVRRRQPPPAAVGQAS